MSQNHLFFSMNSRATIYYELNIKYVVSILQESNAQALLTILLLEMQITIYNNW